MIKQIRKIPRPTAPFMLDSMFVQFDRSLYQLSRHFDHCLQTLDQLSRRQQHISASAAPPPRQFSRKGV